MNYLAGVDEAGLGPILGPLVVAGAAMSGPAGVDPWTALEQHVCRDRATKGKVRVADSKKVYQGPHGLERLENTVLTFWGAWKGELPRTLEELLVGFSVDLDRLRRCPWYRDLALPLPLRADAGLVELQAHGLAKTLAREGLKLLHLAALPVDVDEFNDLIEETDNKSRAHFRAYARVIAELIELLPDGAHLVADRCGGIAHYMPALQRAFPEAKLEKIQERALVSSYSIRDASRAVKITFAAGGEDRAFPTALGSCLAKYLRELMLQCLNRWFCARVEGLRPTAGYYTDGRRFLREVAPVLHAEGFPRRILVRSR